VWVAGVSTIDAFEFEDEDERLRYSALIAEFRCPKCLNTNLSGSDAPVARDLRRTVYRLVDTEGQLVSAARAVGIELGA
jgi:cytochrome c-type biogenesis protein CcmH